jgi:hypothetical protein
MNAIDLLKQQHETTRDALEKMTKGELSPSEERLAADELVAHMVIEEHLFYPRIRELDEALVKESFEEHAVARFELARVMLAKGEEKKVRATVLKELVGHHIDEEEREVLPVVMRRIGARELEALGARMEAMFDKAVEAGLERLVVGAAQELRPMGNGARRAGQKPARARPRVQQNRRMGTSRAHAR